MPNEKDSEEVIYLPFIPHCAVIEGSDTWYGRSLVSICFDPYAAIVADREQIVDDFETVVAGGVINGRNVSDRGVFGRRVVFEE